MLLERTVRDQATVRSVLEDVRRDKRRAPSAPEAKIVADAYGIPVPQEGLGKTADAAISLAEKMGYPVVLKIVSPDILHKTEAGGVIVGVTDAAGVQVQQMLPTGAQEVIVGAVTDQSFGKLVAFGLGGVLVEVLKDVTFRLAPASHEDGLSMLDGSAKRTHRSPIYA